MKLLPDASMQKQRPRVAFFILMGSKSYFENQGLFNNMSAKLRSVIYDFTAFAVA